MTEKHTWNCTASLIYYTLYNISVFLHIYSGCQSHCNHPLFCIFRGVFSDGNFSYGIEPVGNGEVSPLGVYQGGEHTHFTVFLAAHSSSIKIMSEKELKDLATAYKTKLLCPRLSVAQTVSLDLLVAVWKVLSWYTIHHHWNTSPASYLTGDISQEREGGKKFKRLSRSFKKCSDLILESSLRSGIKMKQTYNRVDEAEHFFH